LVGATQHNSSGHRYDRNVTSVLSLVPETFWIEFPGTIAEMMGGAGDFWFWAQFLRKSVKYRDAHPNVNPFRPETAARAASKMD